MESNRPAPWSNQDLRLFHGTDSHSAKAIVSTGISLEPRKPPADFGKGFYGTTLRWQAENWARKRTGIIPVLVALLIPRDHLATLQTLAFAHGNRDTAEDFWSFVWHCRNGTSHHNRKVTGERRFASYSCDVVVGPVALDWKQRLVAPDTDQYGFHSEEAIWFAK